MGNNHFKDIVQSSIARIQDNQDNKLIWVIKIDILHIEVAQTNLYNRFKTKGLRQIMKNQVRI